MEDLILLIVFLIAACLLVLIGIWCKLDNPGVVSGWHANHDGKPLWGAADLRPKVSNDNDPQVQK